MEWSKVIDLSKRATDVVARRNCQPSEDTDGKLQEEDNFLEATLWLQTKSSAINSIIDCKELSESYESQSDELHSLWFGEWR